VNEACFEHRGYGWRCSARLFFLFSILAFNAIGAQTPGESVKSQPAAGLSVEHPFVVTQLSAGTVRLLAPASRRGYPLKGPLAGGMLRAGFGDGARLVIVYPDRSTKVLSNGFHSACDPAISFDASHLLFAGKRTPVDNWNIYEIALSGGSVRQVTRDLGNCRSPVYQGLLYTLKPVGVPSVPEYYLTFVAGTGTMNEGCRQAESQSDSSAATSLYSCKFDGTAVRQLTFNLSSDLDPCILPDGRLVFAAWQRSRLDYGPEGYIGLFGINIDGSDYAGFTTGQGKRIQQMPCVTARGLVVFVEADAVGWDGAGSLASVTLRRPLHSYRPVTSADQGLFHSPSPLPDGRVLVSRRSRDGTDTYGVYRLDPMTGQRELIFDDPDYHDIQAKAVYARPEPDGRSTAVPEDPGASAQTGVLYCLNVYTSDLRPSWLPAGSVQRLRVLEGVALPCGSQVARVGIPPLVQRRILGDIPIEQDGSFNIEVPANTPIELQILDNEGMALRSCGWIWVKDYARQGCIGCHEDPELTPTNVMVDAVKRPSIKLTLPAERRRTVDFRRDVMPIIAGKCAQCHGKADSTVHLSAELSLVGAEGEKACFNRSYQSLLSPSNRPGYGKYVHPGRARTSPLVWHLFGRNMSRPWDDTFSPKIMAPMPPVGSAAMTEGEKRTFVEWIDMGALWDGIAGPDNLPGRETPSGGSGQ